MPRKTCPFCKGDKWVDDENWSPSHPDVWEGERTPGDGRIPCGNCNLGGWNEPDRKQSRPSED